MRELLGDDGGDAADPAHERRYTRRMLAGEERLLGDHVLGQRHGRVGHLTPPVGVRNGDRLLARLCLPKC